MGGKVKYKVPNYQNYNGGKNKKFYENNNFQVENKTLKCNQFLYFYFRKNNGWKGEI